MVVDRASVVGLSECLVCVGVLVIFNSVADKQASTRRCGWIGMASKNGQRDRRVHYPLRDGWIVVEILLVGLCLIPVCQGSNNSSLCGTISVAVGNAHKHTTMDDERHKQEEADRRARRKVRLNGHGKG